MGRRILDCNAMSVLLWLSIMVASVVLAYRWAWRVGHEWGYVDGFNDSVDSVRDDDLW